MENNNIEDVPYPSFVSGGGEMGKLIRAFDWNKTPLGNFENWQPELKTLVSVLLSIPTPMLICWGKEFTQIYNDAFRPINGLTKHPQALGGKASDTYSEIWDTVKPFVR